MGNGGGTNTCLVREGGALETLDQCAHHAAGNAETGEGPFENLTEGPSDLVIIDEKDNDCRADIKNAHEGNDLLCHFRDGFEAADNHGKDNCGKGEAGNPARIIPDNPGNLRMGLIGLKHISAAKRAKDTENGEQNGKKFASRNAKLFKALGDVIHRAAGNGAVSIFVAVFDAKRTFREFRRHAEQSGEDHPECGAGPANADGHRHPRNIAKADSSRQGCCQRLKVADFTGIIGIRIIAFHEANCMGKEAELDKAEVDGENTGRDHQPHDDPGKAGPRDGRKNEIDERPGNCCEHAVYLLVDGHCFLCKCRPGGNDGCECDKQRGIEFFHNDSPLSR